MGLGIIAYWLITMLGFFFQCTPIEHAWKLYYQADCINLALFFLILEICNCSLDIALLCLPLRVIRGLQMPFREKIAVGMIFLLGGLLVILTSLRLLSADGIQGPSSWHSPYGGDIQSWRYGT